MSNLGKPTRRLDVYKKRESTKRKPIEDTGRIIDGNRVNHLGQFVGHGDVARGLAFFNRSRKLEEQL